MVFAALLAATLKGAAMHGFLQEQQEGERRHRERSEAGDGGGATR